jgi:hypothetical protein
MRSMLFILAALLAMTTHAQAPTGASTVLELRQYLIFAGKRDAMIDVFDSKLIEGQEAEGMRLVGQFRDLDDPNRFTWMREFPTMASREKALTDFYTGPIWKAHRGEANPLLEDNDNVLLLRPAAPGFALPTQTGERPQVGAQPPPGGLVIVTIYYLWKDPTEGFTEFFTSKLAPELKAAGFNVLGAYVTESTPNNFPALPVRQHEKVFVWFARAADANAATKALANLQSRLAQGDALGHDLARYQERQAQVLRLAPTERSMLR